MKKRVLALFLGCLLALALCACGDTTTTAETGSDDQQQTEEPVDTSKAETDNYAFEIKDASLAQDYEGNPVIVVTYSWTNNSDETTNAEVALYAQAFQDGVQLETAFVDDSSVYDSEAGWKDIRPGTTLDFQQAYVLTSETSPVEVELSELFSTSKDMAEKTFDPADLA
jgi:hypothetical protein